MVSFLGSWLTTIAVITMVKELSDSSMAISGVLVAKTLPIFLVAPLAGSLADRVDRRLILIWTDLIRAVLVLVMLGFYLSGNLVLLLVVLTIRTAVGGVFIPARTAAVPDLTEENELPAAMALNGGTWSVMLAVGAALGGLITYRLGVVGALVVDAFTFVISAWLLWGLPALPPRDPNAKGGASFLDGLRSLRGRVYLPILLTQKAWLSFSGAALVVIPLYAGGIFAGYEGPLYLGVLYAARGVGALIGSMGVRLVVGDRPDVLRRTMLLGYVLLFFAYWAMALAPTFWLSAAMFVVGMVGSGMIWTFSGVLGQLATTREFRGRLFSMEFALNMLVSSLSAVVAGAAIDAGVEPWKVLATVGTAFVLPGLLWSVVLLWAKDLES